MQQFIDYILNNWQLFLAIVLSVVECFLIIILKKRPVFNLKDSIQCQILEMLPVWIIEAEKKFDKGINKVTYVLNQAVSLYPDLFRDRDYLEWLRFSIESILCTPEKKGGK